MTRQKGANLLHYYVSKQVLLMTRPKTKCTFDALLRFVRFSYDAPKTLIFFHALLHRKAGFLMSRQKGANLLHYYVEKQVFS